MANQLPSFLSGAQLIIKLGNRNIAYAQALSFSHNVNLMPVGGIGSYGYHAIEPGQYSAQGSLVITRYSRELVENKKKVAKSYVPNPTKEDPTEKVAGKVVHGSNTLLLSRHFNPAMLLLSQTFDIAVYIRRHADGAASVVARERARLTGPLMYTIKGCRCTSYSTGLNPGSLMTETMSFVAMQVVDHTTLADDVEAKITSDDDSDD